MNFQSVAWFLLVVCGVLFILAVAGVIHVSGIG